MVKGLHLCRVERYAGGRNILLKIGSALGARNRNNIVAPMQQPRKRNLSGFYNEAIGDVTYGLGGVQVGIVDFRKDLSRPRSRWGRHGKKPSDASVVVATAPSRVIAPPAAKPMFQTRFDFEPAAPICQG